MMTRSPEPTTHAGPERRTPQGTAAGVMDTIADGVTLVVNRPQLVLIPLVVDVLLWLVIKVSIHPLTDQLGSFMQTSGVEGSQQAREQLTAIGDQVMISDFLGVFLPSVFTGMSLDTPMSMIMMLIAPQEFGLVRAEMAQGLSGLASSVTPANAAVVVLVLLASILISSLLYVLFQVPIARIVRGTTPVALSTEILATWKHVLGYIALIAAVLMASLIPLSILSMLFLILGYSLLFVFAFALLIFGSMLGVYTWFLPSVIVLNRTGPIRAFRQSYALGRAFFPQIARFAFTVVFISFAMTQLWSRMATSTPGVVIALVLNAFIGTVLVASGMLYYSDRYRLNRAAKRQSSKGTRPTIAN